MSYSELTPDQQKELREYVHATHDLLAGYRDSKETMAFAGLAVFLGAVATALSSHDWPPAFAPPWLIIVSFTILWLFVDLYLRYQLKRRRWAALRVSGCDWLLAEWLPDSPRAMAGKPENPKSQPMPGKALWLLDLFWPLKASVVAVELNQDAHPHVYPHELERAWILAYERGTDALTHEYLIQAVVLLGYVAVLARTIFVHV
jgi:hypothetical protein